VCERLAAGGRRVIRYDLRDCGASTTVDPAAPRYRLRDLAADAAAPFGTLGAEVFSRPAAARPPRPWRARKTARPYPSWPAA